MSDSNPSRLRAALDVWAVAAEEGGSDALRTAMREVLYVAEDLNPIRSHDPDEAVARAIAEAYSAGSDDAALAAVSKLTAEEHAAYYDTRPPELRSIADWRGRPLPEAVIWRAGTDPERYGTVLSVGEVAALSGPGGTGKSTVTSDLALAACQASRTEGSTGTACGLAVRGGSIVVASYEDAPVRIANRLERMLGGREIPSNLYVWPDPGPLFCGGGDHAPGEVCASPDWASFWRLVRRVRPSLVIVDPASAALVDVSASEGGAVRRFIRALGREASRAGTAILLVAHDTKANRAMTAAGGRPGPGSIAGSGTWHDAARGVLYMTRMRTQAEEADDDSDDDSSGELRLTCIKANYGRCGWSLPLEEVHTTEGRFVGFAPRDDAWRDRGDG